MRRYPVDTFGKGVGKAALTGSISGLAVTADSGNPLLNAVVGGVVGAGVGAVNHIVRSVMESNDLVRQQKAVEERRAAREAYRAASIETRNASLGRQLKGK